MAGSSFIPKQKRKIIQNKHSLSVVVTLCHSLSLVVPLVILSLVAPLVVISLSLIVIRSHSLSLVVPGCITRLSFYKRSLRTVA